MKSLFIFLGILLALAVVAAAGYFGYQRAQPQTPAAVQAPPTIAVARGDVEQSVTAPGQVVNTHEQTVSFSIGGRIAELNVSAGDTVQAGTVLARLDDTALRYTLQTAQANQSAAQAKLNKTKTPPDPTAITAAQAAVTSAQTAYTAARDKYAHRDDQIAVAKTNLEKARVDLELAQSAYDRVAFQSDIGMRPESRALQQATITYQSAEAGYNLTAAEINDSSVQAAAQALAQARATLATLTAPISTDDIAMDQAAVDNAGVAVKQAQDALEHSTLVAPFDGIVQSVTAQQGDAIGAGVQVLQLLDPGALQVRSTVTEEDYALVKVGENAQLYFDARPELVVQGRVTRIVPLRDTTSTSPVYPIYLTMDNIDAGLAPGMTVDASVEIAKRENVLRLPRALVHAGGNGTAQVTVWANNANQSRTIQIGLRGDQYVEILDGLNEGDLVVSR